jgi:cystathionine beta-lyase/cystathionine gamma-synthase
MSNLETVSFYLQTFRLSHSFLTAEERKELNVSDTMIRISVGLETVEDLMKDLDQALVKATGLGPLDLNNPE